MQCTILAAGMGKRLGTVTKDCTKCMVKVNEKPLIDYTLDAITKIHNVTIIVGYKKEGLIDYITNKNVNLNIEYITNDDYEKTNNIQSLWLARHKLTEDDTLVLESDLIFESALLAEICKSNKNDMAVVSPFAGRMDGAMNIMDDKNKIDTLIDKDQFNWNDIAILFQNG